LQDPVDFIAKGGPELRRQVFEYCAKISSHF
jgi:hypothetical protein